MTAEIKQRGTRWGRVSGKDNDPRHIRRQGDIAEAALGPGYSLRPDTTDWYRGSGSSHTVSIEEAAEKQRDLQEYFDRIPVDENGGISHHEEHGLKPCERRIIGS